MARTTIKATYSLPPEVVEQLEHLARRWGVSRSKALTRAIRTAAEEQEPSCPLAALDDLQASVGVNALEAEVWIEATRQERMAMGSLQ